MPSPCFGQRPFSLESLFTARWNSGDKRRRQRTREREGKRAESGKRKMGGERRRTEYRTEREHRSFHRLSSGARATCQRPLLASENPLLKRSWTKTRVFSASRRACSRKPLVAFCVDGAIAGYRRRNPENTRVFVHALSLTPPCRRADVPTRYCHRRAAAAPRRCDTTLQATRRRPSCARRAAPQRRSAAGRAAKVALRQRQPAL